MRQCLRKNNNQTTTKQQQLAARTLQHCLYLVVRCRLRDSASLHAASIVACTCPRFRVIHRRMTQEEQAPECSGVRCLPIRR